MSIKIKDPTEIDKMRKAGRLAAEVLEMIAFEVKAGVSTDYLNAICHDYIVNTQQAIPAPLNYGQTATRIGFPKATCISVNEVVCHGIPGSKILKKGDIVNIDVTVIKDGYHGDTSRMFIIGKATSFNVRLVNVSQECLYRGIEVAKPGNTLLDIASVIAKHARYSGYSVVEDYCGHGIGAQFHEFPQVLHYPEAYAKNSYNNIELKDGMTFTIEPMINAGKKTTKLLGDQWTVITKDRSNSAQWEHTILITKDGCEVLTQRKDESIGLPTSSY